MFIYWASFLILTLGALLNNEQGAKRSPLAFIAIASIPTMLMVGLRWKVGPDWPAYWEIFNYTKLYSFEQSISHADPGFFGLMWVLHQFNSPFWLLNLICSAVFVAGLSAFSRRQPNSWLAFLVAFPYLVIVIGMSGIRQSVALGFLFFAINAFERGKIIVCSVLIVLGALFHGSLLLMAPLCLLSYKQNLWTRALLLIAAGAIGYYALSDSFTIYANRYSSSRIQSFGVVYRLSMNTISAIILLVAYKRLDLTEVQSRLWHVFSVCTILLIPVLIVFPSSTAIDRFLLYLFPLQFAVLSRFPKAIGVEPLALGQWTAGVVLYSAIVQVVFLSASTFAQYYIPYRTILDR